MTVQLGLKVGPSQTEPGGRGSLMMHVDYLRVLVPFPGPIQPLAPRLRSSAYRAVFPSQYLSKISSGQFYRHGVARSRDYFRTDDVVRVSQVCVDCRDAVVQLCEVFIKEELNKNSLDG